MRLSRSHGPAARWDRSRRGSFRAWRRSRPFWGGLLLALGGLEMLLIPLTGVLARGQIKLVIYVGIGGVFGILIGALLIACGLALWFNSAHKTFYAIAGVLLAILSFIGTNLGGFFIGMLLGIVGGSLAFAWSPGDAVTDRPALPPRRDPPPSEGVGLILGDGRPADDTVVYDTEPGEDRPDAPGPDAAGQDAAEPAGGGLGSGGPRHRSRGAGKFFAVAAILAVAGSTLMTGGRASAAETAPGHGQAGGGCILFVICTPSTPSPSPSPSATPSPSPSSSTGGTLPLPGVLPTTGSGSPSPGSSGAAAGKSGTSSKNKNNKTANGTQGLVVASSTSVLTASSATLDGLSYQGAVKMPVSGGGTVTMMKFTMSSQTLSALTQTVTLPDGTLVTKATSAAFTGGNVVLYATKLSGTLTVAGKLGVPLTLSPGNAESTLLQLLNTLTPLIPVTMTGVTADQPVVLSDSASISGLAIAAS